MGFNNIDAPGHAVDRRGVRAIQKLHGSAARKAAAEARRARKRAKKAGPTAIVVHAMPEGGVLMVTPDGAYLAGPTDGRYQILIVGEPKGPPDQYRDGLARWLGKPVSTLSAEPLPLPEPRPGLVVDERKFLSIIMELIK